LFHDVSKRCILFHCVSLKNGFSVTVDENDIVRLQLDFSAAETLSLNNRFVSLKIVGKRCKISIKKASSRRDLLVSSLLVPGTGLEPVWIIHPRDFKSLASTDFATWASDGPP
jgi:hypothetical protein